MTTTEHEPQHDPDEGHDHDDGPGGDVRTGEDRRARRRRLRFERTIMRDHDFRGRGRHRDAFLGAPGRGRMRRGDIRTALLAVLRDGPGHGYDVIQRLEAKSGGAWRPSPGSVYPTLAMLEDEGLVRSVERDGKRVFELTDDGAAEAERRIDEAGGEPWAGRGDAKIGELREAFGQVLLAMRQVAKAGSSTQVERAVAILHDTRKQLYQLLAE
jgi:DNA-binding PadR family transcriptional regulator